jgi:hypothetical protein
MKEAENWGFHLDAWISSADIFTRVDLPGTTAEGTCLMMAMIEPPPHMPSKEFPEKLGAFADHCLALPALQRSVVKHTTVRRFPYLGIIILTARLAP